MSDGRRQPATPRLAGTLARMTNPGSPARPGTIRQGDREKAYRPLGESARRAAFAAGLEAYARGDFFEAHEILEPAWMGTDNLAERALHQGLIKVAAAYVHAGRGNPAGVHKNLAGARRHLALAVETGPAWGVDVVRLLDAVDARLANARLAETPPRIDQSPASGRAARRGGLPRNRRTSPA